MFFTWSKLYESGFLFVAIVVSFALSMKVVSPLFLENAFTLDSDEMASDRTNLENISCQECNSMLRQVVYGLNSNNKAKISKAKSKLRQLCIRYLPKSRYSKTFLCPVLVRTYMPKLQTFSRDGFLEGFCNMTALCPSKQDSMTSSSFQMPEDDDTESNQQVGSEVNGFERDTIPVTGRCSQPEPLTFVQISDIHLDLAYAQGTPNTCRHKICCKPGIQGQGTAGRFGEYRCDSVNETVHLILDSIKKLDPPPHFFVYVGDSSPHSIGEESLNVKLEDNRLVNEMLVEHFRHIAPIFPTIGNHEMYPESLYNRRTAGTQAILASLAQNWPLLFQVPSNQRANIRKHAYYTTLVRPGLRILSTNSLNGYTLNLQAVWSLTDSIEREQQQFIRDTLDNARRSNEKVIHVSHMKPSYTQTYSAHTRFWERINDEFNDVIILQLFGHEHADNFLVTTSSTDSEWATGVFLAAPSVTPFVYYTRGTNPSYRVFKLDPNTFHPLDYDQYYVNLIKANEEYDEPDLSPASFQSAAQKIETNFTFYQKFERNFDVLSSHRNKCSSRNKLCRRILTCETTAPTYLRFIACLLGS